MKKNIQVNNNKLQDNRHYLLTLKQSSDIIKYKSFGILSFKETIWMPEIEKTIFLTAIQVSASLPISILLSDDNNTFLSMRITEPFSTISQHLSSAYRLKTGNALMLSTAIEEVPCDIFGAISATQVNFDGRSDFTNINNAVGLANGSLASLNSAILIQNKGRIILGYNMLPSAHDYLGIEKVVIKYYCRLSLTLAVGVSSMILYWRPSSQDNWITLDQISISLIGTINYLATPLEYDITNTVLESSDPWKVVNSLQTSFVGTHTGLGLGNSVQLDAVTIEICMHGKNQITLFGYEA